MAHDVGDGRYDGERNRSRSAEERRGDDAGERIPSEAHEDVGVHLSGYKMSMRGPENPAVLAHLQEEVARPSREVAPLGGLVELVLRPLATL